MSLSSDFGVGSPSSSSSEGTPDTWKRHYTSIKKFVNIQIHKILDPEAVPDENAYYQSTKLYSGVVNYSAAFLGDGSETGSVSTIADESTAYEGLYHNNMALSNNHSGAKVSDQSPSSATFEADMEPYDLGYDQDRKYSFDSQSLSPIIGRDLSMKHSDSGYTSVGDAGMGFQESPFMGTDISFDPYWPSTNRPFVSQDSPEGLEKCPFYPT